MSCIADLQIWMSKAEADLMRCGPYSCTMLRSACAKKYRSAHPGVACFTCETGASNSGGRRAEKPEMMVVLHAVEELECVTPTQVLRHLGTTGRLPDHMQHPMQIYRLLNTLAARGRIEAIERAFRRLGSELEHPRPGLTGHSGARRKQQILQWLERTGGSATVASARRFLGDCTDGEVREAFRQIERASHVVRVENATSCAWRACTGREPETPTDDAPRACVQLQLL